MLDLAANDSLIKTYLKDLQHLKNQSVAHELGLKGPFQNLLDKAAKKRRLDARAGAFHPLRWQARGARRDGARRVPPRARVVGG